MPAMNRYQDHVFPIWKEFITEKNKSVAYRDQIVESWGRCRQAGVNPYDTAIHNGLDEAKLHAVLTEKQELIKIAKPFMANLYKFVQGSGFVVVLTDENGFIMETFGDQDTLHNPMTNNFFRGACWQEEEAGTNAIGTALIIKEPIQVSGAEHYCQKHHCLTCSAAPIFNNGQIIGILNMSGASYASHLHTLGMVVAAAEAIMAQLGILRKNGELALANKQLTNIFNTMSDGVLMVDTSGIINQLNPAAKETLHSNEEEILGTPIDRIFCGKAALIKGMLQGRESFEDIEIMVETRKNMFHGLASGEPLTDEQGKVVGGVIVLRPIKQIQNLVNRFSGYNATFQFSDIVGESAVIHEAIRVASMAAPTSSNILLQGESGTGKEIFAQAIHNRSEQRNGPFVALNCGVIPRELIGSELFGYVEGAFTGAKRGGKPGKFELASGGTLFLDEISDMPLEQQVALLRVLQEKNVTRIGSDKMISVNVRVICATNKNLLQEVEKGAFRQDLYYRLNVISIFIPPLRSRGTDIIMLFKHFLDKMGRDRNCKYQAETEVLRHIQQYNWPGNVRELQNMVERAVSLAESETITMAHLPVEICGPQIETISSVQNSPLPEEIPANFGREQRRKLLEKAERKHILMLLSKHGGNVSMAAREMGISRNTFYRKMRLYGIEN
jgi:PAS domain S-box-containing protein